MTTSIPRASARRLDREETERALDAARALLLYASPVARTAIAYGTTPEALRELLADLAHDLTTAVESHP